WNPWDLYRAINPKSRTIEPPYVALLNLSRCLQFRPSPNGVGSYAPSQESLKLIREWCSQYGLLGVLPSFYRRITLPAQWLPSSDLQMDGPVRWVPGYQVYVREAGRWGQMLHAKETEQARQLPEAAKGAELPLPSAVCPPEWPRPSVEL